MYVFVVLIFIDEFINKFLMNVCKYISFLSFVYTNNLIS